VGGEGRGEADEGKTTSWAAAGRWSTQPRGATGGGMRRGTDKCEVTGQWGHGFVGPEVSDIFQFCVKEGADSPISMNHNRVIPSPAVCELEYEIVV
jgi:hypothetical protein